MVFNMGLPGEIAACVRKLTFNYLAVPRRCYAKNPYTKLDIERGRIKTTNAYYVLLPEVPPDTPETNAILRVDEYPTFSEISPDNVVMGGAKACINKDVALGHHTENLADARKPSVEEVLDPIDEVTVPVNTVYGTARQLWRIKGSGDFSNALQRLERKLEHSRNEYWEDGHLYKVLKTLEHRSDLSDYESRLVEVYRLEGEMRGAHLPDSQKKDFKQKKYGDLLSRKIHFGQATSISHNLFKHSFTDVDLLTEMPKDVVAKMADDWRYPSRGPWTVVLDEDVYLPFLQYCSDRTHRWNVWWAYNNRSSLHQAEENLGNHNLIGEIRLDCDDLAKNIGYENYMELSMQNKMAGSVDNVLNMLESLKQHYKPAAGEELAELQDFATASGFTKELAMWDIPYWARRHRQHQYPIDTERLAEYFSFPKVLNSICDLLIKLFGVRVENHSAEVNRWDEFVLFFKLFDDSSSEHLGSFYMDPFMRKNKITKIPVTESGRDRSDVVGVLPYSFMTLNLIPPLANQPMLLQIEEVANLFEQFGHVLQQVLTTSRHSMLSGERSLEKDALYIVPFLMRELFYSPSIFQKVSSHMDTGDSMPDDIIDMVLKKKKYMSSYDMATEIYKSAFDVEMYIEPKKYWAEVQTAVWREFMPLPLDPEDRHPCSFTAIFAGNHSASYYSFIWSKMIAADLYKAFDEVGFENQEQISVIGRRFRDTYLSRSGAVPANDLFRMFMGRDPTQDALKDYSAVAL